MRDKGKYVGEYNTHNKLDTHKLLGFWEWQLGEKNANIEKLYVNVAEILHTAFYPECFIPVLYKCVMKIKW